MNRKYTRMELFEELLDSHEPINYGMAASVKRPSQFWPDCQTNTFDEIANWHNDLKKEKEGNDQFTGNWGMGTSFKKPIDINILIRAYYNAVKEDRFGI